MPYSTIMYFHLVTVVPCFFMGTLLFLIRKGTSTHRNIGKVYMFLMLFTGVVTLFMPAQVGLQLFNHFGLLHLLSLLTIYAVPTAYLAARKGNIRKHKSAMIQLYVGGLLIAGGFTFVPGRFMYDVFFG